MRTSIGNVTATKKVMAESGRHNRGHDHDRGGTAEASAGFFTACFQLSLPYDYDAPLLFTHHYGPASSSSSSSAAAAAAAAAAYRAQPYVNGC